MNKYLSCLLILFLLSGCSDPIGGKVFFEKINDIEQAIDQQEWNKISQQAEELKSTYIDENRKLINDQVILL